MVQHWRHSFENISERSGLVVCFSSTLFTGIQTWYQIQPNYKSSVNLPKTFHLQCYSMADSHSLTSKCAYLTTACDSRRGESAIKYRTAGDTTVAESVNICVTINTGPQGSLTSQGNIHSWTRGSGRVVNNHGALLSWAGTQASLVTVASMSSMRRGTFPSA